MQKVDFSRLRCVICDDNQFMRRVLRSILTGYGVHDVYDVQTAEEAHTLYLRNAPDVMIIDWEMPGMNGIQLTKLIRKADDSPNRFIPIIMVSGFADRDRVIKARDAGITEFLCKPVSAKALYRRILSSILEPRPFVMTDSYFGPDRRRFIHPNYDGKERRIKTANAIKVPSYVIIEENGYTQIDGNTPPLGMNKGETHGSA